VIGPKLRAFAARDASIVDLAEVRERRRAANMNKAIASAAQAMRSFGVALSGVDADEMRAWMAEVNARERARRKRLEWLAVAAVWGLGVAIVIVCEIFN
jgi:hypothetical protein